MKSSLTECNFLWSTVTAHAPGRRIVQSLGSTQLALIVGVSLWGQ